MKNIFLLVLTLFSASLMGQDLMTLSASDGQHLTLFFPDPIRQAVTGAENFTFSYNREQPQYFGLLQANPGTDSNLLVVTTDGQVYNYHLEYKKSISETYRFISQSESIGFERPLDKRHLNTGSNKPAKKKELAVISTRYREEYFEKFSSYQLEQNRNLFRSKRKKGLVLRVRDLIYHQTEVYVILEIENKSMIDFELDYLKIFKLNGNKRRKSSYQKLELKPLYTHMTPKIIEVGKARRFLYVLPKFTLGDAETLLLELHERKGNRMLRLFHK